MIKQQITIFIAMRTGSTLDYLLSDHLGSTSLTTDANGNVVSELRYTAWGTVRYTSGTTQTKYTYTGQYSNVSDFGLMYYNARWLDPALGRFAQADTDVPASQGVQSYDRYVYVNNNPVRYTDPSGHRMTEGCGDEGKNACAPTAQEKADYAYWQQRNDALKCQSGNTTYCSYAENYPVETAAFVTGGLALAGAGAAAVSATTITVETAVTTTTLVESTNTFCGGDMCTGEVDELPRFFHSGYGSQVAAETLAKTYNAITLSQTETGTELNQIFETSGYNVMRPLAETASADWAAGASGRVDIVLKLPLNTNSIWATIEYPTLLHNDAVTAIVLHNIP